ncbi:DUF2178 domain-containing protein [Thermococcus sp. 2319x1]|uniref:DUF2178 domain-containing protein n=1 Tax=Thermococcus sp. 2319x1 TaxID=1674923 RepID=UPI001583C3E1|nr:DUF2178 domain-containing protein [Thermococcus sp. 2319x1]
MNELAIVAVVSFFGGALLGTLITRIMLREIGLPADERAMEIDKRTALSTLKLVMGVDIVLLYYHWFITKNSAARDTALIIFMMVFFGIWIFRAYYARRI